MGPRIKISAHDLADPGAAVRALRREADELAARHPGLTACHFSLSKHEAAYEARLELLFPQHQVIVNGAGAAPERALKQALSRAEEELAALARRDSSLRTSSPAARAAAAAL